MTTKGKLAVAGALVAATMLLALYAVLPVNAWNSTVTCSAILLALLSGTLIFLPSPLAPSAKTNAAKLALLGPMGLTILLALGLAAVALLLALFGRDAIAWTFLVLSVGSFAIGNVLASAAATVVDNVARASTPRYQYEWRLELETLACNFADKAVAVRCEKLAEDIRYAPSPVSGIADEGAAAITAEIGVLQTMASAGDVEGANKALGKLERLLTQHWQAMIAARSHA